MPQSDKEIREKLKSLERLPHEIPFDERILYDYADIVWVMETVEELLDLLAAQNKELTEDAEILKRLQDEKKKLEKKFEQERADKLRAIAQCKDIDNYVQKLKADLKNAEHQIESLKGEVKR